MTHNPGKLPNVFLHVRPGCVGADLAKAMRAKRIDDLRSSRSDHDVAFMEVPMNETGRMECRQTRDDLLDNGNSFSGREISRASRQTRAMDVFHDDREPLRPVIGMRLSLEGVEAYYRGVVHSCERTGVALCFLLDDVGGIASKELHGHLALGGVCREPHFGRGASAKR